MKYFDRSFSVYVHGSAYAAGHERTFGKKACRHPWVDLMVTAAGEEFGRCRGCLEILEAPAGGGK